MYWVTVVHLLFFLLFVILSVGLLLLLRMTFFYRIVEEKIMLLYDMKTVSCYFTLFTCDLQDLNPALYSIQFLVINFLGIDLLLYPPVLRPALLKKVRFFSNTQFGILLSYIICGVTQRMREIFWEYFVLFTLDCTLT